MNRAPLCQAWTKAPKISKLIYVTSWWDQTPTIGWCRPLTFQSDLLTGPHAGDHLETVSRLYRIVYGRPADRGGLLAYVSHLDQGLPIEEIVSVFLASDEFRCQLAHAGPLQVLLRHAFGSERSPAQVMDADPSRLVLELLRSERVIERFPLLPSLYPTGVPIDDVEGYRIWLAGRRLPDHGAPPSVSVIIVAQAHSIVSAAATAASLLIKQVSHIEVLVPARWFPPASRKVFRQATSEDSRLRLLWAPWAMGHDGLFNAGLRACKGQFTALIGPDDRLDKAWLAALGSVAGRADVVLSDEDSLSDSADRQTPVLGGAWDSDHVLAAGCSGLTLIRTAVLRAIGGMRRAGTRDMLLRAAHHVGRRDDRGRIVHVPQVLLSRRKGPGIWAGGELRPGTGDIRATIRTLREAGSPGCKVTPVGTTLRIAYPLPKIIPLVSIVIATRDRAALLERCVDGLLQRTNYSPIEVVIVDNGSAKPDALNLLQCLAADVRVKVLRQPGPFNWAALNNAGVAASSGKVTVLLNNDIDVIEPGWLHELVCQACRADVGAVGAKLLYPDGRIQHAGLILSDDDHALHRWRFWPGDSPGYCNSLIVTREVVAVTGACMAMRRDVYDAVGGCDAESLPVTWNDIDLCMKVRAHGLRVIWTPHARLLHLEQATRGSDDLPENHARFLREQAIMQARWGVAMRNDPFRIANLFPDEEGRRLAIR